MIAICTAEIKGSLSRVQTEARFQYAEAMVALGEAKGSFLPLVQYVRYYRSHPARITSSPASAS
jgi:hypothetical protein